jgi:hypothetical protein
MNKLVFAILLLIVLLAAGVYSARHPRVKAAQPCWNKLVQIEGAKEQWALENRATSGTPVSLSDIEPFLKVSQTCHVAGATYIIGKIGEEPRCTAHGTVSQFKPDRY